MSVLSESSFKRQPIGQKDQCHLQSQIKNTTGTRHRTEWRAIGGKTNCYVMTGKNESGGTGHDKQHTVYCLKTTESHYNAFKLTNCGVEVKKGNEYHN